MGLRERWNNRLARKPFTKINFRLSKFGTKEAPRHDNRHLTLITPLKSGTFSRMTLRYLHRGAISRQRVGHAIKKNKEKYIYTRLGKKKLGPLIPSI